VHGDAPDDIFPEVLLGLGNDLYGRGTFESFACDTDRAVDFGEFHSFKCNVHDRPDNLDDFSDFFLLSGFTHGFLLRLSSFS
jgi:hypothetical protein